MRVFGEFKIPCQYKSDNMSQDWLHQQIASEITEELLNQNLIKFEERYAGGYYIMNGSIEVEV